jgi:hypothetical protein
MLTQGAQLDAILENWSTALRSIFKDPSVKANIDILDADDQQLIDAFRDGSQDITPQNAATLRKLIGELSKGFERISIQSQDLRKVMNKPMTIDQAKAAIDDYLDDLAKGKDRSKVRIIFSEEK